jgi:hypothetical protein
MKNIKLKEIANIVLTEIKGKWHSLSKSEVDSLKKNIYNLINTAYSDIGGHVNFKNVNDVLQNDDNFLVIDLDDDPDIDGLIAYKDKYLGNKHTAIGHDGTKPAKKSVLAKQTDMLQTAGNYVEVSEKMVDIMKRSNIDVIDDEDEVRRILAGKDIEWLGNGLYRREIGGKMYTKSMYGKLK